MRHYPAILPNERIGDDGFYRVEALCGDIVHETDVTTCLLTTCPDCHATAQRTGKFPWRSDA